MTPRRRCTLAGLLLLSLSASLFAAGWQPVGPYGGTVGTLAVDPSRSTVLAGTPLAGLFRSEDRGATWAPTFMAPQVQVGPIAFDRRHPGRFYAAVGATVLLSSDYGRTWSTAGLETSGVAVTALAVDPSGGSVVYASADALFRSTDRGRSWQQIGAEVSAQRASAALAVDPASSSLYSVAYDGIYRSRDGGVTWRLLGLSGINLRLLALAPSNPAVLYTGGDNGLYRSTDGGAHWRLAAGLPSQSVTGITVHPSEPSHLYVALRAYTTGEKGGLFQSLDGGGHWSQLSNGLPAGDMLSVALDPVHPERIYVGRSQEGVYRSLDSGRHWSWANQGLRALVVAHVVPDPQRSSTVWAGPADFGLYQTTDTGHTWRNINNRVHGPWAGASVAVDPLAPSTVYTSIPGRLERSDDDGQSWRRVDRALRGPRGLFSSGLFALDPRTPSTLYAVGNSTISKSEDGGETWAAPVELSPACPLTPYVLAVSPAAPNEIYVSGLVADPSHCVSDAPVGLVKSVDGGATWTRIGSGFLRAVAPDPADPSVVYALDSTSHLVKSTDGGASFAPPGELARTQLWSALEVDPRHAGEVYAAVLGAGQILLSVDGGVSWQHLGGLVDGNVLDLAADPTVSGRLWAGTDHSVFVFNP
ncbi:MAG TPA: hypothetical protein VMM92_07375 [Thermoanaerobaculia bacterium]|nr:hypothetical protein [Thermoanaerobaculia bacterium]